MLEIFGNVSLQFTGIFYLHLHSHSSLAKTWLSIRNRISPGLKVFHVTHYLCSECSFVFFLNRLTANERASISKAVLEIEVNAVIYIHTYLSGLACENIRFSSLFAAGDVSRVPPPPSLSGFAKIWLKKSL